MGAQGGDIPLGAFHVVNRNEGGLAALRMADIHLKQFVIYSMTECVNALPLGV